jgi:hypothetical protein
MPDTTIQNNALTDGALVDLTRMVATSTGLTTVDIALLVIGGGIGFLGKKPSNTSFLRRLAQRNRFVTSFC